MIDESHQQQPRVYLASNREERYTPVVSTLSLITFTLVDCNYFCFFPLGRNHIDIPAGRYIFKCLLSHTISTILQQLTLQTVKARGLLAFQGGYCFFHFIQSRRKIQFPNNIELWYCINEIRVCGIYLIQEITEVFRPSGKYLGPILY